jgi:hypothetical protein
MNIPPELPHVDAREDENVEPRESLPMLEWQKEELDRREQMGELPGIPWAEAKRQILNRDNG